MSNWSVIYVSFLNPFTCADFLSGCKFCIYAKTASGCKFEHVNAIAYMQILIYICANLHQDVNLHQFWPDANLLTHVCIPPSVFIEIDALGIALLPSKMTVRRRVSAKPLHCYLFGNRMEYRSNKKTQRLTIKAFKEL